MRNRRIDFKLIGGLFFSYLLIYVAFGERQVFWYLYTAAMLFLISYTIINEKMEDDIPASQYLSLGLLTGAALYAVFFAGDLVLSVLPGSWNKMADNVYAHFQLEWFWHYLVLIFVIVPGEEIFWRGFILKRILAYTGPFKAAFAAAILNASAYFFTGYPILIIAGFFSGLVWGCLYVWKKSIPLLIISHVTFDLLLLVFLPLN
ncbi:MAG TPA: CPBP family intramembrane glutamic endopeptidase [Bacillaceae bacterium]